MLKVLRFWQKEEREESSPQFQFQEWLVRPPKVPDIRQKHAVAAIRQATEQKPEAFHTILKQVVLSLEAKAKEAAPEPKPVAAAA